MIVDGIISNRTLQRSIIIAAHIIVYPCANFLTVTNGTITITVLRMFTTNNDSISYNSMTIYLAMLTNIMLAVVALLKQVSILECGSSQVTNRGT